MFANWVWFILLIIVIVVAAMVLRAMSTQGRPESNIPWSANIERATVTNEDWRRVLTTTDGLQVVAMTTPVGESLGWEVHPDNDQFFRVERGRAVLSTAKCIDGRPVGEVARTELGDGSAAVVPRGTCHNVVNIGPDPLRMYTIYGPKHHPPGTVDHTHADEIAREIIIA